MTFPNRDLSGFDSKTGVVEVNDVWLLPRRVICAEAADCGGDAENAVELSSTRKNTRK